MTQNPRSSLFGKRAFIYALIFLVIIVLGILILRKLRSDSSGQTTDVPLIVDTGTTSHVSGGTIEMQTGEGSMMIQLSEGQTQPQTSERLPLADGEPLPADEVKRILARLSDMPGAPEDQVDFKLAQQPIPPPRTGETIQESFPPTAPDIALPTIVTTTTGQAGPLQVLRFAPEGEIPVAPFINVTFNQPMVALDTVESLTNEQVPVVVEPALAGTWRWLGTKTLNFQYDSNLIDRLPKATEYHVSVPAGTTSAIGGVLAEVVSWSFTTPPAKIVSTYPYNSPQPLEPIFFIAFDQRIDPAAVLETLRVTAGSQTVDLKLVSEAEIKDTQASNLAKNALPGRWLAFQASKPLPPATIISVIIGPGTPSAEGPLVTKEVQSYSFSTYTPLRIEEHGCYWSDAECRPLTPFYIRFNNPIDAQVYQEGWLHIEPKLPGVSVNIFGNTLEIRGATQGQTTYTVTVSKDTQDTFGQRLGKDARLTFKVGQAEPMLVGPEQAFITLDPASKKPVFSVYAINYPRLDVKIYAVQPNDWPEFKRYLREWQQTDRPAKMPGQLVTDKTMRLETPSDILTQVDIDLRENMDGDYGHFVVVVAPPKDLLKDERERYWRTVHAWVQVTQIGVDAFTDHSEMVVWTTALKDGTPLSEVTIQPQGSAAQAATGADGTARFAIPTSSTYLVARRGADQAILPRGSYLWDDSGWSQFLVSDMLRWYVFDDRQMYRPGEQVHLKGWLRRVGGKQDGDVSLVSGVIGAVQYRLMDAQGNYLGSGYVDVNALGGFDFTLTLPEQVNLGAAQLYLVAQGRLGGLEGVDFYHNFQIQEFRRPEFEVSARSETPGPYFAGNSAVLAVEAKYYAGGALPNADVTWEVSNNPSTYDPPNWPDFTFGTWQPWWFFEPVEFGYPFGAESGPVQTFTGKTDAAGVHYLRLDFDQGGGPRPYSVLANATVMDVNRQAWSSTTALLVHPADLYIGLRSERYFVERGQPLKVDFVVVDLDGNPVEDRPVELRAARLEWKVRGGDWKEEEVDVQKCNLGSQLEVQTCTFETPLGGSYRITATVTDSKGRQNQSQFIRWVSGGQVPPARKVEKETATLIPDKESYQPGDIAQILVQSPFTPAEGLLTVSRSGILYTQRFVIKDGSITLEIPITEKHLPNLNIQVDLAGAAPRLNDQGEPIPDAPERPAYASAQLNLRIPPLQRTLSLQVSGEPKELMPGGEATISIVVRDAAGQPVPDAELAVVVIDEAILALTNYQLADPIAAFYTDRPSYFDGVYGRASIVLVDPQTLLDQNRQVVEEKIVEVEKQVVREAMVEAPAMAAPMPTATAALDMAGAAQAPIQMRIDFNPLAAFVPAARTDASGSASLPVKLPDNLTRYRIMVVAVEDGQRFGMGESNLVARLPLMVRPSAPRFLNFGDHFELPVVLQNQTDSDMQVDVVVRASNLELLESASPDSAGLRVTVPARDRVEVRFPVAAQQAGTARLQIAAVSGEYADAATISLPVYTPATTEAFATYGVVDQGAVAQPVAAPTGVFPQFGGLEINTSSTALQALTDAVLYLVAYPFECTEQLSSRILAIAALRDVLTAFEADGLPAPAEMEAAVQRDITRLQGLQNDDGGFPYWRRGFESIPFNTIHVAHAFYRAQQKGFSVPTELQSRTLDYLRQIESFYPSWYSQQTRWTLSTYALYVRNLLGDRDVQKALRLLNEAGLEKLSLEAVGWLWPVLQDAPNASSQLEAIRRQVSNRAVETAGAANFITSYDEQTYLLLSSDRRTDAILLDALILDSPQSDLIPKLVNGLLAHRTRGRWGNTQENVFVLLALDRYFNTFEAQTPDFVARLWLGETYAGSHEFKGRTTERHETVIPMPYLVDESLGGGGTQNLVLSKEGPGRLYYRLGLRYAPVDLNLKPLDMGFVVQRRYEAVDDPGDVYQDSEGVWHIKAGARVRIRVTMVADNRRYHVALVDPLPAGLEIVNPALAVSGSTPQDPGQPDYRYGWWWWWTWYEHQNLRDERAEAFTSLLWDGVYDYSYIARATTPGTFIAPPAKAEEMYSPEVFGRSSSDWVIIEEK